MKAYLEFEKIRLYIELHKKMSLPFKMIVTNYTTRITSNYCDIHFLRTSQGARMFAAYAMLKKDVSRFAVPVIDNKRLVYFDTGFEHNIEHNTVYNFDLKSAYATCLFNSGFIEQKTFEYLGTLPKIDRLAAVGMLAGRKSVYYMNADGNPETFETVVSPLEGFFFHCVKTVSELMNYAASYMGNSFLFTWVDGIYFRPNDEVTARNFYKIVSPVFNEQGYKTSFEILNNFKAESRGATWFVSFLKDGKPKVFCLPKKEAQLKQRIETYLLNKNYKQIKTITK